MILAQGQKRFMHMFTELMNFFGSNEEIKEEAENEVLKRKLKRLQSGRTTTGSIKALDPAIPTVDHHKLVSHWTECAQSDVEHRFYETEPHVVQMMNNSKNLMQPGSAEVFQLCKPHPLDELNERRRKEEELDTTRRFFQLSKLIKNSA
jgi:hypothetical protein